MKSICFKSFAVFIALGVFSDLSALDFKVDKSHTNINFEVSHLVISTVTGRFDDFSGSFKLDKKGNLVAIEGVIQAASINTNNEKRDKHLRSEDFFNVTKEKHKTLQFKSDKFSIKKGSTGKVSGKMTLNGVTKPVTFKVKYLGQVTGPWGAEKAGFNAETTINRKEFGLSWNEALETGGVMVGEEVTIKLNIQGNKFVAPSKK